MQQSCLDILEHRIRIRMKDMLLLDITTIETEDGHYTIERRGGVRTNYVKIQKPDGEIVEFASKRTSGGGWLECIEAAIDIITTGSVQTEDNGLKRCARCRRMLPRDREHFNYNRRTPDGFTYRCIECKRLQNNHNYHDRKARA